MKNQPCGGAAILFNRLKPKAESSSPFRFLLLILSLFASITSAFLFHSEAFCGQATLAWDTESTPGLAGYKVYFGTASRNYPFAVDAGTQTTATITGLTAGATYYFAATAYDSAGTESAFSSEVVYTVPATSWKIAGIGDFNNDGKPDIFWQYQATGSLSAWPMNGTSLDTLATVTPGVVSDIN